MANRDVQRLIEDLGRDGIRLSIDQGGVLQVNAPDGLDAARRAELEASEAQVVAYLAASASPAGESMSPMPGLGRLEGEVLTAMQRGLWFISRMEPRSVAYNIVHALDIQGALDVDLARRCLEQLHQRHASLRTRFVVVDGEPRQVVDGDARLDFEVADLDEEGLGAALEREARRPLDLERGPLFLARLFRLAPRKHMLVFSVHHIVFDGWSWGILLREFGELYTSGGATALDSLPLSYADFSRWQERAQEGPDQRAARDFWSRQLQGAPEVLRFPTDIARPVRLPDRGGSVPFRVDEATTAAVRKIGRQHGFTPYQVLLGAFQVLLSRYSGEEDLVVGIPFANRGMAEVESVVGYFVNTLPFRQTVEARRGFADLVRDNQQRMAEIMERCDYPFERIVADRNPVRSLSHAPIFQHLFVYFSGDSEIPLIDGLDIRYVQVAEPAAKYDFVFTVDAGGEAFKGVVQFNAGLFEKASAERWVANYVLLLEGICADPERPVGTLGLVHPQEQAFIDACLDKRGLLQPPPHGRITDAFEHHARSMPDAPALRFGDATLSYAALDDRAAAIASHLQRHGVGVGDLVGICVSRGPDMIASVIAVLKAGAAYVPLDPGYPVLRLRAIAEEARLRFVLCDAASRGTVARPGILELDLAQVVPGGRADGPIAPGAGDVAHVIFTSGSTGRPKGVKVTHDNVLALLAWVRLTYGAAELESVLCGTSLCFDLSVFEIWAPLSTGGAVVLVETVGDLIGTDGIRPSLINTVPSALRALIGERAIPDSVRVVNVAGEPLDGKLVKDLRRYCPGVRLYNLYGPTEDTTYSTFSDLTGTLPDDPPIGVPLAGSHARVLDAQGRQVPVGVVGELYLGGAGVSAGYLNDPALTQAVFLRDPSRADAVRTVYRTGDLVSLQNDGQLHFVGRNDSLLKLRGFRIDLGDVECALRQVPGVFDACVSLHRGRLGDGLVAYVATEVADGATAATVEAGLRERLPDYMVPAAFVMLEQLPRTPNGKIDRKALPAPDDRAEGAAAYEPPASEIERSIADVWRELLGLENVGRNDNFFSLGGHSLLAVRVLGRLAQRFEVVVPLAGMFAHPTLEGLARVVAEDMASHPACLPSPPIDVIAREGKLALSLAQQRLWFLTQLDPEISGAYHVPMAYRLRGSLDVSALRGGLDVLWRRHEALRTAFVLVDGAPQAHLLPAAAGMPLVEHDLRAWPDREERLARCLAEESQALFDLAQGPLVRACLVRLADDDGVLLITQHHMVSDGWSMAVLVRELGVAYLDLVAGAGSSLPALKVQYLDYAAWQRRWLDGEHRALQAGFWREALAGAPVLLELPTDRPRPPRQSFDGGIVPVHIDAALAEELRDFSRQRGATLFMTVLTAWSVVLAKLSNQRDLVVGTPAANRSHHRQELEPLVGLFVNMLALRIDASGDPSVDQLLARVREVSLAALEHQDLPFDQVVEIVNPPRRLDHAPLFQVVFAWQNNEAASLELPNLWVESVELPPEPAKFDLQLTLGEIDGGIRGTLGYATALFDRATIERHCGYLTAVLRGMVAHARQPALRIDMLSPEERTLLLDTWNPAATSRPGDLCLHQMFERHVRAAPDAVALVAGDRRLTYAQLDARANRLARLLIEDGVRPDDRVALCVERNLSMVVGVLAILKAGGAYVPLDPSYPAERLRFMLEDSAPTLLVVQDGCQAQLGEPRLRSVVVDDAGESDACRGMDDSSPRTGVRHDHLAYVIYTSGSTGKPKGVLVEHRQVRRLLEVTEPKFHFGAGDVWTLFHSYTFDFSVWELWGALAYGGRLVVVPQWLARSPEDFYRLLGNERVTVLNQTPTAFGQLMQVDARLRGELYLRVVVFGGEALKLSELRDWVERRGDAVPELVNMYGITETTVHVTYRRLYRRDVFANAGSVIGRPLPDLALYLLDEYGGPVPLGAPGELYVGGAGVARGYLNRPELTRERFTDDPRGSGRLYRTGDLARYLPNGELVYLGRIDGQVKVRGFRIELGEIEHRLSSLPGVSSSIVVVREDIPGIRQLVGYVVPADAPGELVAEDRADQALAAACKLELSQVLPDYMVPASIVVLSALPKTLNGKVDRGGLPKPDTVGSSAYLAPRDAAEQALCEVWQEVLQLERVGVLDNYFSLGGDSILSIRVVGMLRERGLAVTVRDIFQYQTVEQQAAHAQAIVARPADLRVPFDMLGADERAAYDDAFEDAYPMSALQLGMVFHSQLERSSGVYHDVFSELVSAPWDPSHFEAALASCIGEHPVLRTGFRLEGERPLQHVFAEMAVPLEVVDLRADSPQDQDDYLAKWLEQCRDQAFDWSRGPLLHCHVFRRTDDCFECAIRFHHSILDGWSHAALRMSLYGRYMQGLRGEAMAAYLVDWTYRDFVALERQVVADPAAKSHFLATLEDSPAEQLPRRKGSRRSYVVRHLSLERFGLLSQRLIELARVLGVPVQAVLLAAHFKALSTMSGQAHAMSCVVHNGRPETEGAEQSLGLFLNSVPLCLALPKGSWRELIEAAAALVTEGMAYRRYPLSNIQQDMGRSFDEVLFNYVHFHAYNALAEFPGLDVQPSFAFEKTNFDLVVNVARAPGGDGLKLELVYDEGIHERDVVLHLGGYFLSACERMLAGLDQPHARMSLLSVAEQQRLASHWGQVQPHRPDEWCIHHMFELQVELTPDAIALVHEGRTHTYAQLNAQANRLARCLIDRGVAAGDRVAIHLRRRPMLVACLLAVLKAGGAYVPLDPRYPAQRLRYILEDATPRILLSDEAGLPGLEGVLPEGLEVVDVDALSPGALGDAVADANPEARGRRLSACCAAYVMYTSGSTGQPKGVVIEHSQVANLLRWSRSAFSDEEMARMLFSTSINFDLSVFECFAPLTRGGALHLVEDALALIESPQEVSIINTVPSAVGALLDAGAIPASVRTINMCGEPLKDSLVKRVFAATCAQRVCNLYGPTETTVYSTWACMPRDGSHEATIGHPIANTRVYLLGADGLLVPFGSVGEVYIGGAGVARGYLGRPDLTAERFGEDPFRSEPGTRMYRTGDLARYLQDGRLSFMGRNDHQIKVRGYRIETGEVEACLCEHPQVDEAIVVAREDRPDDRMLVAYVRLRGERPLPAGEWAVVLREYALARLPDYMVPAAFIMLDHIPRTPNGKVDRLALPAPGGENYLRREFEPPREGIEQLLASIWKSLLGTESIGRHDNFFQIGGNSLVAVQMLARANRSLEADLVVREVFELKTIARLANRLSRSGAGTGLPLVRVDASAGVAISYPQQSMWNIIGLDAFAAGFNMCRAMRLTGRLDSDALRRALEDLMRHQDSLRTTFSIEGEEVQMRLNTTLPLPLRVVEVQGDAGSDERVLREIDVEWRRPFNLGSEPPFRALLLRLSATHHVLVFTISHLVADEWSFNVIRRELGLFYAQETGNTRHAPAALPYRYADFADWQRRLHETEPYERQIAYWHAQFADIEVDGEFPIRPSAIAAEALGTMVYSEFVPAPGLAGDLGGITSRTGSTAYVAWMTALHLTLAAYSGLAQQVVWSPLSYRPRTEFESAVGFYTNLIIVPTRVSDDLSVEEFLGAVERKVLDALANGDVSVATVMLQRPVAMPALPMVRLNVIELPHAVDWDLSGLEVAPISYPRTGVVDTCGLDVGVMVRKDELLLTFGYNTAIFDEAGAAWILDGLQAALGVIANAPAMSVGDALRMLRENLRAPDDGNAGVAQPECVEDNRRDAIGSA